MIVADESTVKRNIDYYIRISSGPSISSWTEGATCINLVEIMFLSAQQSNDLIEAVHLLVMWIGCI